MVVRALAANPDVAAAQATLREARGNTRAEQGSLFPQLSVSASASGEREHNTLVTPVSSTYSLLSG